MVSTLNEKPPFQPLHPARQVVVLLFIVIGSWYLHWRLDTFNEAHPIFSRMLYGAELFGFFTALLNFFMTLRLTVRYAPLPPDGLKVDVFITTYNEEVEIVRRTALASQAMNYPHQTWILDDGNRPAMREMASSLGLRYLVRGDNTDAKAGNLNHALLHSHAQFIVTFDADHAPSRDFLTRTLGYFSDEKVAFVQTPQDFYNLDSFQNRTDQAKRVVWSEQTFFFHVIQPGKDYWNAAFYCGSCSVLRRQALDCIGGFATGTVTEDIHTSLRLHKKGYRSVYHNESLAYGMAPPKIEPFFKQRLRWGIGAMNVWRKEGILFTRGLTFAQRINYLATVLAYFDGWQKCFFYFTPVYVLMAGAMPIHAENGMFLLHFLPYIALNFLSFEEIARGYGRSTLIEQYNMARFASLALSTIGIFKTRTRFGVTSKKMGAYSHMLLYLLPPLVVIGLNFMAMPVGIFFFYWGNHLPESGMWANVFWASLNTWLAFSIVLFTQRHDNNRRDEYRFHLPIAARLDKVLGTIDDLSPKGMNFYGMISTPMIGKCLPLVLYLPDGPLVAEFEIRNTVMTELGDARYVHLVGGTFHLLPLAEEERIEQFLYGSKIQWELNHYQETSPTFLQRLGCVPKMKAQPVASPHWASCEVTSLNGKISQHIGTVCSLPSENEVELLVSQRLESSHPFFLAIHSRLGIQTLRAEGRHYDVLPTGGGALYRYRMHVEKTVVTL
jgi:cellulose synthase (UDP-forming)